MTIEEIKKLLDHGDYVKIARLVGYSEEQLKEGRKYVYKVLTGKKIKGSRGIGKKIIEAAEIIAMRNHSNGKTPEPTENI